MPIRPSISIVLESTPNSGQILSFKDFDIVLKLRLSQTTEDKKTKNTTKSSNLGVPHWNNPSSDINGLGIVISGGYGASMSVEVFNPLTNQTCQLPSLPFPGRNGHTMHLLTICGGSLNTSNTCITLSSGQWVISHLLSEKRWHHCSWSRGSGSILIGGIDNPRTTETVTQLNNKGIPGFNVLYNTR